MAENQNSNSGAIVQNTVPNPSYPMMNTGIALPYIALFSQQGIPIINPVTGIPIGCSITRFSFKFEVDEFTESRLEFTVPGVQIADNIDLQEGVCIAIQWGYIYPETRTISSKPQLIRLKEVDYTFDDSGTHVRIKGHAVTKETLEYLPQVVNPKIDDGLKGLSLSQMMDAGFNQQIGIVMRRFKKK